MLMTKGHVGIALLAAAGLATAGEALSATTAQAPAAALQALENIETNREAVSRDRYREAVTAFGDSGFRRWHEQTMDPKAGIDVFYADTAKTAVTEHDSSLEAAQSMVGVEYGFGGGSPGRWATGFIWADQTLSASNGSGNGDLLQGYGQYSIDRGERAVFDATLAYTTVSQSVEINAQTDGQDVDAQVLDLTLRGQTHFGAQGWLMRPSTALAYRYIDQDAFDTQSAGAASAATFDQLDWVFGVEISHPFILNHLGNSLLTPYVGAQHHVDLIEPELRFQGMEDSATNPALEKTRWSAGLDWQFTPNTSAEIAYHDAVSEQVSASFQWRF